MANTNIPAMEISNLTVAYNNQPVLWDITTVIPQGMRVAIIGPNGAGKTTLMKTALTLLSPLAGTIKLLGKPHTQMKGSVAYVPQRSLVDWDFPITALDLVVMGTYGKLGWIKRPGTKEYDDAYQALESVGMLAYANRPIGNLSGGQQQRIFIARALVQDAPLYMLDEPFLGIDKTTEQIISALFNKLCDAGKTIIVVHHDLHTVSTYFDWVLMINKKHVASGPLTTSFTPEYLQATFNYSPFSLRG